MNTTATYTDQNGTVIGFRKSLRNEIVRRHIEAILKKEKAPDAVERDRFIWIAPLVSSVEGIDWTPPQLTDSKAQVEASYQQFLDAVTGYDMFNGIIMAVNGLYATLADEVQRPDEALTDDERADPN